MESAMHNILLIFPKGYSVSIPALLVIIMVGCSKVESIEQSYFGDVIHYLLNDDRALPANSHANIVNIDSTNVFVLFIDGTCQLCALDLSEISNINTKYFKDKSIAPVLFIYDTPDSYITDLISKKHLFDFPIFIIEYQKYLEFINRFDLTHDSYLLNKNLRIIYKGSPLRNHLDLKVLTKTIETSI